MPPPHSLGTLGDSIGLTLMSAYAVCIVQLPVAFVATLNYPGARVDLYTSSARVAPVPPWPQSALNGTGVDLHNPVDVHYTHAQSVSFGVMGVAALCAVFATVTVYLRDKGLEDAGPLATGGGESIMYEDFTTGNPDLITNPTITMWNSVFLWLVVAGHALLAAILSSPGGLERIALFALLIYVSMAGILQPRVQTDGTPNASSYVSSSYTAYGLMYVAAMLVLSGSIPYDPSSARIQLLAAAAFLDCFLLFFGHAWDASPMMQTIMNCRMLYAVAWSVVNVASFCLLGSGVIGTQFFDSSAGRGRVALCVSACASIASVVLERCAFSRQPAQREEPKRRCLAICDAAEPVDPPKPAAHTNLVGLPVELLCLIVALGDFPMAKMGRTCRHFRAVVRGITKIDITHLTCKEQSNIWKSMVERRERWPHVTHLLFSFCMRLDAMIALPRCLPGLRTLKCCVMWYNMDKYLGLDPEYFLSLRRLHKLEELDIKCFVVHGLIWDSAVAELFSALPSVSTLKIRGARVTPGSALRVGCVLARNPYLKVLCMDILCKETLRFLRLGLCGKIEVSII